MSGLQTQTWDTGVKHKVEPLNISIIKSESNPKQIQYTAEKENTTQIRDNGTKDVALNRNHQGQKTTNIKQEMNYTENDHRDKTGKQRRITKGSNKLITIKANN